MVGALKQDQNNYVAAGPFDPASGNGRFQRGSNVGADFADSNVVLYDASGNPLLSDPLSADAAATGRGLVTAARETRYNGATWDRLYNNASFTLLASSTRTATTTTPVQTNYNSRGLWIFLNATTVSAGGLKLSLNYVDPVSGVSGVVWQDGTFITATGIYLVEFFIGGAAAVSNVRASISRSIPRTWTVTVTHGDANNQTYSLGGSYTSV
jgi:hypothetical protein